MTTPLFDAAIRAAARQARADKVSISVAKKALSAAYALAKPQRLPQGVTIDEWGALRYAEVPGVAAYSPDNLLYATTLQQIGNIRVQCGMNDAGEFVPAGPGFQGWAEGQTANAFQLPLQKLVGITSAGAPRWEPADGPKSPHESYLFPRLRLRISGRAMVTVELDRFAQRRAGG